VSVTSDGGPAFPKTVSRNHSQEETPLVDSCTYITSEGGMSLRDYFAAKALQGMLAGCPDEPRIRSSMNGQLWAQAAYAMADAMLAARNSQPTNPNR